MNATDVVVIGAGIIGSSTAYYLVKAGADVTLIDSRGPIPSGTASPSCAGGIRHQGRVLSEISLALYSIGLWASLENELDCDLQFRQGGMTIVVEDELQTLPLEARVRRERALGLDVQVLRGSALHDKIPGLSPKIVAGSYCPSDGHANPMVSAHSFAISAQRLGARVVWNCPADGLVADDGAIRAVRTPQGDIPCQRAVLAAGAWSPSVAATVGLDLPIHPVPLQMMVTAACPHQLDQVLAWSGRGISLKQVPSGAFVIGGGWPALGALETGRTTLYPGSMAKSAQVTVGLFPSLESVPVVRAWAGIEGFCTDELPIVGPVPGLHGLDLAAGFSGHGFALGPGVGSLVAQYIITGEWSALLEPFRIERFDLPRGP